MKKTLALLALLGMMGVLGTAQAQEAVSYPNEGATGTTVGKLAKFTAANPSTAILAATTDVDNIVGIVVAQDATSTTGNAKIAVLGPANCTFDASGATAGHYVVNSAVTAGACADGGASRPTATQVIGRVTANVAASASGSVNLTIGFTNAAGSGSPANPTATAGPTAVNGSASTFLRSDGAPAVQKGTNAQFGIIEGDGSTLTCVAGVCTAIGGSATSIVPGTTTVGGATAPCLIDNSASTTMGCAAVGTGVLTALGVNVGSAGAPVVLNGALGTPSSGTGTNITGIVNNNVLAATLATGTSVSLTAPREYYVCTGTCTVTPPVPAAGYEFCVMNDDNVTTVITLAAIGSSARYEATARTSYGTAGTGTFVSGGAAGDKVCLLGRDSTHYLTVSFNGTWTAN